MTAAARHARGRQVAEAALATRGSARKDIVAELRRLANGQFAPKGAGQVLRAGDRVKLPGGDLGQVREGGAVHSSAGKKVGALAQPEGLDELIRGFAGAPASPGSGPGGKVTAADITGGQSTAGTDVASLVSTFLSRRGQASPGEKVGPIPGTDVTDSPGRGPTGKLRNFKAMSDEKLKGAIHDLHVHGLDSEAIESAHGEASGRGLFVPGGETSSAPKAATKATSEAASGGPKVGSKIKDKNGVEATVKEQHGEGEGAKFTVAHPAGTSKVGYKKLGDVMAGKATWPSSKAAAKPNGGAESGPSAAKSSAAGTVPATDMKVGQHFEHGGTHYSVVKKDDDGFVHAQPQEGDDEEITQFGGGADVKPLSKPTFGSKAGKPDLLGKLQAEDKAAGADADPNEELQYERDELAKQDKGLETLKGTKIYSESLHAQVKQQLADAEEKLAQAKGGGAKDGAASAALEAYKSAGGNDPAVIAALGGGPASSQAGAVAAPQAGGMKPNSQSLSIKDLPIGAHFKMNDGNEYVVHKPVGDPWYIVKPAGGGKAKPMHKMLAPPMIDTAGGSAVPQAAAPQAEADPDELFDKLKASVAQAKGKGKIAEAELLESFIHELFNPAKHPRGRGGKWAQSMASHVVDLGGVRERNDRRNPSSLGTNPYQRFTKSGRPIRTRPMPSNVRMTLDHIWHSKPAKMAKNKWAEMHLVYRTLRDPRVQKGHKMKLAAIAGAAVASQIAAPMVMDQLLGPAGSALGAVGPDDLLTGALLHHAISSARGVSEEKNGGIHPVLASALRAVHANDSPTVAMHKLATRMTEGYAVPGVHHDPPATPGTVGRRDAAYKRRAAA